MEKYRNKIEYFSAVWKIKEKKNWIELGLKLCALNIKYNLLLGNYGL